MAVAAGSDADATSERDCRFQRIRGPERPPDSFCIRPERTRLHAVCGYSSRGRGSKIELTPQIGRIANFARRRSPSSQKRTARPPDWMICELVPQVGGFANHPSRFPHNASSRSNRSSTRGFREPPRSSPGKFSDSFRVFHRSKGLQQTASVLPFVLS